MIGNRTCPYSSQIARPSLPPILASMPTNMSATLPPTMLASIPPMQSTSLLQSEFSPLTGYVTPVYSNCTASAGACLPHYHPFGSTVANNLLSQVQLPPPPPIPCPTLTTDHGGTPSATAVQDAARISFNPPDYVNAFIPE